MLRIVPYAAIHFSAYEKFRRLLIEHAIPLWSGEERSKPVKDEVANGGSDVEEPIASTSFSTTAAIAGAEGAGRAVKEVDKDAPAAPRSPNAHIHPVWDLLAGSAAGAS